MGGKWTTYRIMAEETIDKVALFLQNQHGLSAKAPSSTKNLKLLGSFPETLRSKISKTELKKIKSSYIKKLILHYGLEQDVAKHLINTYGIRAFEIA